MLLLMPEHERAQRRIEGESPSWENDLHSMHTNHSGSGVGCETHLDAVHGSPFTRHAETADGTKRVREPRDQNQRHCNPHPDEHCVGVAPRERGTEPV